MTHDLIVVGGGIGGSAAALRAAQHGLAVAWIRGDESTARASRARYVFNVDNMIGVHDAIVKRKVLELLSGPEHAAARAALEATHFHIGTQDIVDDAAERLRAGFADQVTFVDRKAVAARRLGADLDDRDSGPVEERHVLVDDAGSETSVKGLFAVGDMSRRRGDAPSLKQIYTAQEYAVRAVQTIDRRRRSARRKAILAGEGEPRRGSP